MAFVRRGKPFIRDGRFYGIFNGGEWAYCNLLDKTNPWTFVGGVASLVEMERAKLINWCQVDLSTGKHIYVPKLQGNELIFIYDTEER